MVNSLNHDVDAMAQEKEKNNSLSSSIVSGCQWRGQSKMGVACVLEYPHIKFGPSGLRYYRSGVLYWRKGRHLHLETNSLTRLRLRYLNFMFVNLGCGAHVPMTIS